MLKWFQRDTQNMEEHTHSSILELYLDGGMNVFIPPLKMCNISSFALTSPLGTFLLVQSVPRRRLHCLFVMCIQLLFGIFAISSILLITHVFDIIMRFNIANLVRKFT